MPVSTIESGGYEVFASGTVTAFGDAPIEFTLERDGDEMELVFDFREDDSEPYIDVEEIEGESRARIAVYNHTSGQHVGAEDPFNVGIIGGRALHLIYHVTGIQRENGYTPVFSYTFYLGAEIENPEEVAG